MRPALVGGQTITEAVDSGVAEAVPSAVDRPKLDRRFFAFYAAVVFIQGVHVIEHHIQLVQVYALGIPDKDALGLLGYVFQFQGTEEWLHLAFNTGYVVALIVIAWGFFVSPAARSIVPGWALVVFAVFGVGLELWHVNEHIVIISNVIANDGCPCPGILDERLGISDTVLHYGYNMVAYVATLLPFLFLVRKPRASSPSRWFAHRPWVTGPASTDVRSPDPADSMVGAAVPTDRTVGPAPRTLP